MHAGRIQGATRVLGAPAGWNKRRNGHCSSLAVRDTMIGDVPAMTSAWIPTPEEVDAIAKGAPIFLTVVSLAHPVVALSVGEAPSE